MTLHLIWTVMYFNELAGFFDPFSLHIKTYCLLANKLPSFHLASGQTGKKFPSCLCGLPGTLREKSKVWIDWLSSRRFWGEQGQTINKEKSAVTSHLDLSLPFPYQLCTTSPCFKFWSFKHTHTHTHKILSSIYFQSTAQQILCLFS